MSKVRLAMFLGHMLQFDFSGVTDFKAVKGSSSSEGLQALSQQPELFLLLSVGGGIFLLCSVTLCIFVTFRRQVGSLP